MVARAPTPSVSPTKPDIRHTGRETTVDKRDKRQMLDKLIELKDRCGRLDDEDRTVALLLDDVQLFVAERWAAAVAADAEAAEAAATLVDERAPGR
jgi:hypothetical protein